MLGSIFTVPTEAERRETIAGLNYAFSVKPRYIINGEEIEGVDATLEYIKQNNLQRSTDGMTVLAIDPKDGSVANESTWGRICDFYKMHKETK